MEEQWFGDFNRSSPSFIRRLECIDQKRRINFLGFVRVLTPPSSLFRPLPVNFVSTPRTDTSSFCCVWISSRFLRTEAESPLWGKSSLDPVGFCPKVHFDSPSRKKQLQSSSRPSLRTQHPHQSNNRWFLKHILSTVHLHWSLAVKAPEDMSTPFHRNLLLVLAQSNNCAIRVDIRCFFRFSFHINDTKEFVCLRKREEGSFRVLNRVLNDEDDSGSLDDGHQRTSVA